MKNYGTQIKDSKTTNPNFAELKQSMRTNGNKVGEVFNKGGKHKGCGCDK